MRGTFVCAVDLSLLSIAQLPLKRHFILLGLRVNRIDLDQSNALACATLVHLKRVANTLDCGMVYVNKIRRAAGAIVTAGNLRPATYLIMIK